MIFVKFIVLIGCINRFCVSQTDYCKICLNHTLCKYYIPGPSPSCKSYDNSAVLRNYDITELVNKINERRNFVALGHSKILPQAANMKKIHWSSELAFFAQRWVDQCVSSIHPEEEDLCRDLENTKVGQVISSVVDPTSKINVKSFVEMWFIQILNYSGSVIYYNQSQDYRTSYFTQLLWADTEAVGCGKAKFYVDEKKSMLERLVCNFAPKGNTHGKPIYSIGYPGTQCSNDMVADNIYKGLCNYEDHHLLKTFTTLNRPMNSLLRIFNLSNNSAKLEIDPIGNNFKQMPINSSSDHEHRNQKTRHIFLNNSYGPVRRMMPLQRHNAWKSVINMTRNDDDYHYQHERGHSHLYHGHNPPQMYSYPITNEINYNSNQDFRRYDYTTQTVSLVSNSNYRKFYQQAQCTRRWPQIESNGCCGSNQCTKGPDACCQQTTCPTPCPEQFTNPVLDLCSCTIQTCRTTCPSTCTTSCCNVPCQYSSPTCPTTTNCCTSSCEMHCNDCRKSGLIQNYDMFPNVVVRSGNKRVQEFSTKKEPSLFRSLKMNHSHQRIHEGSDEVLRDETDVSKFNLQDHDYMYRSFDTRLRKRRQLDDQITLVPFWQLKKSNNRNPSQLKSMRYTTLTNKNNRNTRRNTALAKWLSSTEPITLNIADYEDDNEHVTEKFLSFNELMHLRKINDGYAGYDFRRDDSKKTTKKKESTKNDKTTKDKTTNEKTTKTTKAKTNKTTKETTTKTTKSKTNKTQKETKATKVTVPVTEQAIEVDDNSATEMVREEEQHTHYSYETTLNPYANLTHFPYPPYYNSSYYTTEQYYTYTTVDPYYSYTYHAYETTAYYTHEETHIATVTFTLTSSFERLKYCTRKLTCTWTSYTANSRGDGDNGNDWSKEIGSRTPPGYVEGCTRTSTCTRINMDRNKVFTVSRDGDDMTNPGGDGTGDDGSATGVGDDDDGDYCERRSLNVQRRNSDNKESLPHKLNDQDLNLTIKSCKIENELNITSETRGVTINVSDVHDCVCVKNYSRKKRQENYNPKMLMLPADMLCRDSKKSFSYGELYYMILNRVFGSKRENQFHRNECACNGSNTSGTIALLFLLEYFISMFNVYIYGIL